MKRAIYLLAVVMLTSTASSVFTTFTGQDYRETQTLRQGFELNLGYSESESYRVELEPVTGDDLELDIPRTSVPLNSSESDRTVLMPSGKSLQVKSLEFTASISPDSLKRNHSFSINVNVEPAEGSGAVGPKVIHQRTLDYTLYTSSDQVRENRIESNDYSGEVLRFEEGEVVENETVSETEIQIDESDEDNTNSKLTEKVENEEKDDWGLMTYILAGLILLTSGVILKEVVG